MFLLRTLALSMAVLVVGATVAEARTQHDCAQKRRSYVRGKSGGFIYKNKCDWGVKCKATFELECNNGWAGEVSASCKAAPGGKLKCISRGNCTHGVSGVRHIRTTCVAHDVPVKKKKTDDNAGGGKGGRTWSRDNTFKLSIAGHWKFSKVTANNHADNKCKVTTTLFFNAGSGSLIRFQARVAFQKRGRFDPWIRTDVFENKILGGRKYQYTIDTTPYDCWGKKAFKPTYLWIESCRTAGCTPKTPGPK